MAEIIRAAHAGFCFGVQRAIDRTEQKLCEQKQKQNSGGADGPRIFTYGPLIHNRQVTDDLARRGVSVCDDLDRTRPGDVVIVRSHGETRAFFAEAARRQLEVTDATCPFVQKIHRLVEEAYRAGRHIVIIGDRLHPEVQGTDGWCDHTAAIVGSAEEAAQVPWTRVFLVCQTTIRQALLEEILQVFAARGVEAEVHNTICDATRKRQEACGQLAETVDAMVIVGGKESSNTRKLYEISKKKCKNSFFVENITDLPLKELKKCNKIGVAAGASTPECVIKEVIASMSEVITNEKNSMEDFMDEIDASLRLPRAGEIIDGKVHQVTEKEVIVNMGCKKDGILPVTEVTLEEGQKLTDLYHEGDEIQAKVIKTDDGDGGILLSKKRLEINEHWNEISAALEDKSIINVKVIRLVNGGVIAAYKEVTGFIPLSQLSDRYVEKADEFLGQALDVKVTRVDQKRGRAVFSHKAVLNEERQKRIAAVWESLKVGEIVEGTVMRFTDYGAFIDLGGIDGLLHISEISWGKLRHPQEVLQIGDRVKVMILAMNEEKGKISLGLKQTTPEPWSVIDEHYQAGQIVRGKVVQIKEYGAFVELEPGLDGLVHISEVAHKRVTNVADEISVGEMVYAKILDIDKERKRISLSIKEALDAVPAEEPVEAPAEPEAEEAPAEAPAEEAVETAEAPAEEAAPAAEAAEEAPAEEAAEETPEA